MNDVAPPPTFSITPLRGFMQDAPDPQGFAFYPLLPRRVVTLLGGHGGSGKSYLALALLAHGACGMPFADFHPEGVLQCVYCSLEDSNSRVRERLRHIVVAYHLDAGLIEQNLCILDGSDLGTPLVYEINEYGSRSLQPTYLLGELRAATTDADFIVIDNASDAYDGDENNRREVRAFVRMLTDLARGCDAAVMLLAHIDKVAARGGGKGQSYSGSTAWHNGPRSRLALVDSDGDTLTLYHEKANFTARAASRTLRRDEHGVPLIDAMKIGTADRERDAKAALLLMEAAAASDIVVLRATTGPVTAWHVLKHLPEAEPFTDKATGPKRLATALEWLCRQGAIQPSEYRTGDRKIRNVWMLTSVDTRSACTEARKAIDGVIEPPRATSPRTPLIGAGAHAGEATAPAPICANGPLERIGADRRTSPDGQVSTQAAPDYLAASEGEP